MTEQQDPDPSTAGWKFAALVVVAFWVIAATYFMAMEPAPKPPPGLPWFE